MKKLLIITAVLFLCVSSAQALTVDYGWEDGNTILGTYKDIIASNDDEHVHTGERALKLVDDTDSGTPQAYVGWLTGLQDGDQITAGFWIYDTTPGAAPSARIWGSYTETGGTIDSYSGSAGGNSDYGPGTGWHYAEYTWTFDADGGAHDGLLIQARTYSNPGDTVWIDDLTITAPDTATIHTAAAEASVPVPGAIFLLGSGLAALAGFRRS